MAILTAVKARKSTALLQILLHGTAAASAEFIVENSHHSTEGNQSNTPNKYCV
jgi:hypothetical protein